jgi:hypothetical protein
MKRVSYGIKEVKLRSPESRTEEIPEIAFSEAVLNTGTANIEVSLGEARDATVRILDSIFSSALGKTHFQVIISAYIPKVAHTLHIVIFNDQSFVDQDGVSRMQNIGICFVSAQKELAAKIKNMVPTLEIDGRAENELKMVSSEFITRYFKEDEVIAVFDLDRMEKLKGVLDSVLKVTEGMGMGYELFVSTGITTPLMGMTEYNRTRVDGSIRELSQEELDRKAEEYRRETDLLDPLSQDFLAIGAEYPWEFALTFMSEGAFYGYEWERRGSLFQNKRYKHPVGRLKIKGADTHKFILHWDGECYRIEITDMEPDSELGREMNSFGISFEATSKK